LEEHPVQNALFKELETNGISQGMYKDHGLSSEEMSSARSAYLTNMTNMWKNKRIISRLLNHTVETLLRIHLAPVREKQRSKSV
jgi:hypothetical protein